MFCYSAVLLSSVILQRAQHHLSLLLQGPSITCQLVATDLYHRHGVVAWYCISCQPPPLAAWLAVARCARSQLAYFSRHDRNIVTWQALNLKSTASLLAGQEHHSQCCRHRCTARPVTRTSSPPHSAADCISAPTPWPSPITGPASSARRFHPFNVGLQGPLSFFKPKRLKVSDKTEAAVPRPLYYIAFQQFFHLGWRMRRSVPSMAGLAETDCCNIETSCSSSPSSPSPHLFPLPPTLSFTQRC